MAAADLADPQSLNRYAYVQNDPIMYADSLGLYIGCGGPHFPCPVKYPGGATGEGTGGGGPCGASKLVNDDDIENEVETGSLEFDPSPPECNQGGGGGTGPSKPPTPVSPPPKLQRGQPQCFAQLKTRAVQDPKAELVGATHSFWYVQGTLGHQWIISAGPSQPQNGFLDVWTGMDVKSKVDNVSAGTTWNSGASADNCNGVDNLLTAADIWPQNQIPYKPFGPNSNTAARYFGDVAGFGVQTPQGAWGWNTPLPNLLPLNAIFTH